MVPPVQIWASLGRKVNLCIWMGHNANMYFLQNDSEHCSRHLLAFLAHTARSRPSHPSHLRSPGQPHYYRRNFAPRLRHDQAMQSNFSPVHLRRDPPLIRFGMRYSQARFRRWANPGLSNPQRQINSHLHRLFPHGQAQLELGAHGGASCGKLLG